MLSLNDLKEKRIVFVTSYGGLENSLKFSNSNICLYREGKLINKISCHIVISIFIIGECTITSQLIKKAKEHGISIFLLNHSFKNYAEIMSVASGNYNLRKIQYTLDKPKELKLSKMIVCNKLENQFNLLNKLNIQVTGNNYLDSLHGIENARHYKTILGIEGNYASNYFQNLFKDLEWYRRAPRTKEDIPNFLLDIGYTYLFNYVDSLLNLFGFDTYKGFYHQLFFQRQSLSCDLVEPFRVLVDRQLLKSYHLGQIDDRDFKFRNGAFMLKNYKLQKKYTKIWFDLIMDNKESIYNYILSFYRYMMNPDNYPEPRFVYK